MSIRFSKAKLMAFFLLNRWKLQDSSKYLAVRNLEMLARFLAAACFSLASQAEGRLPTGTYEAYEHFAPSARISQLSVDGKLLLTPGAPTLVMLDENLASARVGMAAHPSQIGQKAAPGARFSFAYLTEGEIDLYGERCHALPEGAKASFEAAANIWASFIRSSVPITISVCWTSLDSEFLLGYSIAQVHIRDFPKAPHARTWYTKALANALSSRELASGYFDLEMTLNGNATWYYPPDGNTPAD